jgi:hypothetical protein
LKGKAMTEPKNTKPAGFGAAAGFSRIKGENGSQNSTATPHDFRRDFDFADTAAAQALVRQTCYRMVVDCCGVSRASPEDDKRGIDYWVSTPRRRFGLDLKLRRRDFNAGRWKPIDCVIELDGHGSAGWLLKAHSADLILFATIDTHRAALFHAKQLRTAVLLNLSRWIADGRAREITTASTRDGAVWQNRAFIVNAETLQAAIERQDDDWREPANEEWEPT